MDGLDVPWNIHPLQGMVTPYPRALDNLSLQMPMTMHTKVGPDGHQVGRTTERQGAMQATSKSTDGCWHSGKASYRHCVRRYALQGVVSMRGFMHAA